MAATKIATLVIRTLAKPISIRIKDQARQHERFRGLCVSLAQFMYRTEARLRTNILGETTASQGHGGKHIRPLSEAKAIENGANLLAEGFLFAVAAALIIGETWRSSRKEGRRREGVDDQLEELKERIGKLEDLLDVLQEEGREGQGRTAELARIIERVVEIGMRGGWKADLQLPSQRVTNQEGFVAPLESASESPSTADSSISSEFASLPNLSKLLRIIGGQRSCKFDTESPHRLHEPFWFAENTGRSASIRRKAEAEMGS